MRVSGFSRGFLKRVSRRLASTAVDGHPDGHGRGSASKKFVLLFPGQGSLRVGMGKDVIDSFEEARFVIDEANDALGWRSGALRKLLVEGPHEDLCRTKNAQPVQLAFSIAILEVLRKRLGVGNEADVPLALGHSLGEFTALQATGCIRSIGDAVRLVSNRGKLMQHACDCFYSDSSENFAMTAVFPLDFESAKAACSYARLNHDDLGEMNVCQVANVNSPTQVVISGTKTVVDTAVAYSKKQLGARRAIDLPVSAPFHSSVMSAAEEPFSNFMEEMNLGLQGQVCNAVSQKIIFNFDAQARETSSLDKASMVKLSRNQLCSPVLWSESVERAVSLTSDYDIQDRPVFVEAGGKVLSGLVKASVGRDFESPIHSIASLEDISVLEKSLP